LLYEYHSELSTEDIKHQIPSYQDSKVLLRKDLHDLKDRLINFLGIKQLEEESFCQIRMNHDALKTKYPTIKVDQYLSTHLHKISHSRIFSSVELIDYWLLLRRKMDIANYNLLEEVNYQSISKLNEECDAVFNDIAVIEFCRRQLTLNARLISERQQQLIQVTDPPHQPSQPDSLAQLYLDGHRILEAVTDVTESCEQLLQSIELTDGIDVRDLNFFVESLLSVFIFHTNRGDSSYDQLNYKLHRIGVDKGLYDGAIEPTFYRNIVYLAYKAGEYDWALNFAKDYKTKLPEHEQSTAYSFNIARIYINMGDYGKVVETLRDVEYKDITYNLNSKLMLMTSFFQMGEYDFVISTIRAFKVFLRRKKSISVARKKNFVGHCDVLYQIVLAIENRDKKRLHKAREILSMIPSIPNSGWLKGRIKFAEDTIR
ncbi:MAG: hypothetical protein AAFQ02_07950, partial [Bacteroidota bacterium]